MEPKKIALLVGAVVVALVTALLARQMFVKSATPVAAALPVMLSAPKGPKVLVATHALPVGTILDDASFKYQQWPKELIQGAYYVEGGPETANTLRGAVVRTTLAAGQPLTKGSFVQPGDRGFLAAALAPGMRAITVQVSRSTNVAGFVFPGDHVDLMLTQTIESQGSTMALRTTETIVRNLRVLATDQRTVPEDDKGKKEVKPFEFVTLEVTPRLAEKIAVAQSIASTGGQLSLSLRPLADTTADLERAIAAGEVNVPAGTDPKSDKALIQQVASRPADNAPTYVTGADVSRFARRSVPPTGVGSGAATGGNEGAGAPGGGGFNPNAKGPVVRVRRGNDVTEVSIGGK